MKRLIFLALVGMILLAVAALGYKIVRVSAEKDATALRIRTLPDFRFFTDSIAAITPARVPPEKALVIIHFLPDCHFCQGEAKELAANAALFGGTHFLWVSAAESKQIREFGTWYGLANLPSHTLARDSLRSFGQTFGTASVPTTFVYSALRDGKRTLLKQFTGETSAEAIRKTIGQENNHETTSANR
jgi:hypothetical protein